MAQPVLVVDDDPALLALVADLLRDEGYCVQTAGNGAHALALLRAGPCPVALLTDLAMPVMDGWSLLKQVREAPATAALPVVVLTAEGEREGAAERARAFGVRQVLSKPFALDTLLTLMAQVIRPA